MRRPFRALRKRGQCTEFAGLKPGHKSHQLVCGACHERPALDSGSRERKTGKQSEARWSVHRRNHKPIAIQTGDRPEPGGYLCCTNLYRPGEDKQDSILTLGQVLGEAAALLQRYVNDANRSGQDQRRNKTI